MNEKTTTRTRSFFRRIVVDFWPMFLVVVAVAAFLGGHSPLWFYGNVGTANEYGDSFGFVNAMVSALAFAALVVTLMMQSEELELQRRELKRTALAQEEAARLGVLATYLSTASAIINYRSSPRTPDPYGPPSQEAGHEARLERWDEQQQMDRMVGQLKGLMDVLITDVRKGVPEGALDQLMTMADNDAQRVLDEEDVNIETSFIFDLDRTLERVRWHLTWREQTQSVVDALNIISGWRARGRHLAESIRRLNSERQKLGKVARAEGQESVVKEVAEYVREAEEKVRQRRRWFEESQQRFAAIDREQLRKRRADEVDL